MLHADEYISESGVAYDAYTRHGYQSVEQLPSLKGMLWDAVALGYIHGLRPSYIRVVPNDCAETTDSRLWRVTVYLNEDHTIKSIQQEIEVGLPEGVVHGKALEDALLFGLDSEQVAWHLDAKGYLYSPVDGYYKQTDAGYVPYPNSLSKPLQPTSP